MIGLQVVTRIAGMLLAALLLAASSHTATSQAAPPNDVARVLAGLPPAAGSAATPFTQDAGWQAHARSMDDTWRGLERRQISRIRAWSAANIKSPRPALLYMFSGPDFLYANAFFPNAETYVLAGLEPVGPLPELTDGVRRNLTSALGGLRASMSKLVSYSFFITKQMKTDLRARTFSGTLPLLYVFLARSGNTIQEVKLVQLDAEGRVQVAPAETPDPWRDPAFGVEIVFTGTDAKPRRLYYFRTDLSDAGIKMSGIVPFVERLGHVDSLIKSASYLLHSGGFTRARQLLLDQSEHLVQDDSGAPLQYFKPQAWDLKPFGRYLGPIGEFPGRHQKGLADLFQRSAGRLDFGIGYRWRPNESNLLLAIRREAVRTEAGPQGKER